MQQVKIVEKENKLSRVRRDVDLETRLGER